MSRNYAKAVRWYRRAAEQGIAEAQLNLAVMYARGRGVPKDTTEFLRWLIRAAEGGNASAQSILGAISEKTGKLVQAYKWYSLAASAPDAKVRSKAAENMRRVGQRMTPGAIARAKRLALAWRPKRLRSRPAAAQPRKQQARQAPQRQPVSSAPGQEESEDAPESIGGDR